MNNKYLKLENEKLKNKNLTNECSICCSNINNNEVCLTKCGHLFCYDCIYKSIDYNNKCPTCREKLNIEELYWLQNTTINKKIIRDIYGTKIEKLIQIVMKIKIIIII